MNLPGWLVGVMSGFVDSGRIAFEEGSRDVNGKEYLPGREKG